jgi:hypothetical protein
MTDLLKPERRVSGARLPLFLTVRNASYQTVDDASLSKLRVEILTSV